MHIGSKKLVKELNKKLCETKQAVFRTRKRTHLPLQAYTLLNTATGERYYLSFEEALSLARKLGVLSPD